MNQSIVAARQPDAEPQGANDEPRRSFYLTLANDLLGEPATTQWLIPKILPTNCLAMLVGDPAAGKSFLTLHWAALIATEVPQTVYSVSGPVVYIAGEGYHGIKKRLKAWFLHHGVSSENVPLFVSSTGTSLDTKEGLAEVEAALDKVSKEYGKPKLVIIDTLHRNMQGDENSSQDVGLAIKAADQIRVRYEAAVLVVHHSGHTDKSRGRGSSSLRAAVDVELLLSVKGNVRTLGCSKMKDSEPFPPSDYELKSVILPWTDETGNFETSAIILPTMETPKTWASQENAPKVKKQSTAETLGLSTLKDAMGDTATVTLEDWRECFYRKHHGDSTEAKRKAFSRTREGLTSKGLITVENDLYSFAESRLDNGTYGTYGTNVPPLSRLSGRDMRDTPDKILKDCLVSRPGVPLGVVSDGLESVKDNSFKGAESQEPDYEEF
ncbi:MAG: AAA family ATPase [Magnetococcales bacterium]|nr:AAA family ATPase [Magnetococcales bacterium]